MGVFRISGLPRQRLIKKETTPNQAQQGRSARIYTSYLACSVALAEKRCVRDFDILYVKNHSFRARGIPAEKLKPQPNYMRGKRLPGNILPVTMYSKDYQHAIRIPRSPAWLTEAARVSFNLNRARNEETRATSRDAKVTGEGVGGRTESTTNKVSKEAVINPELRTMHRKGALAWVKTGESYCAKSKWWAD
jgi:hypothetical protein